MTLRKALGEYRTIYMAYRNFADGTRVEYQHDLEHFIEFAEKSSVIYTRQVGLPIVERFIAGLEQKGYSSLTRKRKVVTIRSYFSFLYQDGYIATNIAKMIIVPFIESVTPHVLTQTECDRLRKACSDNPRDAAIIELLLQTGITLSELTRLTLNDIEIVKRGAEGEKDTGFVRILGRRAKKERMIQLNAKACLVLRNYIRLRKDNPNLVFFLNRSGEPLRERGVQKMLRKYLKSAGIERASIHTLRHTFGAHQVNLGVDLNRIQETMGHKDSRTTSLYFILAKEAMGKEVEEHTL